MDILEISDRNLCLGRHVLKDTGLIEAWQGIGATVYIVGSLKTGLMMKNKDIDLHIYTDNVFVAESFWVMQQLAERLSLKEVHYRNLIDTEEECVEWHALYDDKDGNGWKFDMIHIRKGSKYDGVVERVTDTIGRRLTPDIREKILRIKFDIPEGISIPGIEIYHGVFAGGVGSYEELQEWRRTNPLVDSLEWMP